MTSLTILDRNRRPSAALVLAVVATVTALTLPTASGQTAGQLPSARWIPTDLNYALISHLRANDLQSPIQQIQGNNQLVALREKSAERKRNSIPTAQLLINFLCRLCHPRHHSCRCCWLLDHCADPKSKLSRGNCEVEPRRSNKMRVQSDWLHKEHQSLGEHELRSAAPAANSACALDWY